MMNAHARLVEYGIWLLEPGIEVFPNHTVEATIKSTKHFAQAEHKRRRGPLTARGKESRSTLDNDGGLGAMIDRMASAIERDNRCREIQEAVGELPVDYQSFVRVTYESTSPKDIPRRPKSAACILGCTVDEYYERRTALFAWLDAHLEIRRAA